MSLSRPNNLTANNPFFSVDEEVMVERAKIESTLEQPNEPTLPARARLHPSRNELEEFSFPSQIVESNAVDNNPYTISTPSISVDSVRTVSSKSAPRARYPTYVTRTSSLSTFGFNEKASVSHSGQSLRFASHTSPYESTDALRDPGPLGRPSGSQLQRLFQLTKQAFSSHIDAKTIVEMIDFRELVYPFGIWKYTVLALVGMAIAGIVVSEHYFHWIETSMAITRRNMIPVLVVVIGLEPIMISIILLVARVPPQKPGDAPAQTTLPDIEANIYGSEKTADHRTALVIPCHNSDRMAMTKVLESAYPHFRPQDIFIVDNGRTKYPPDDFRQFIREQHPDIVYMWSPIGSKNAAQLVGALAAKQYSFIMTVDDDVSIPPNFRPPIDKIDHLTKGVAFPLRAMNSNSQTPLFMVAWQDCEYKMSGLSKLAESSLCGVLYPHGAGWFCERETLIDLISNYHSLDFIAEDVNTGLSMQKMKKRIAFDARIVLETEVPTTIFGPGLNWWHQRKNSWEMGRHGRLLGFAGRLFLSLNGQNTIYGIFTQKAIHLYAIASIVVDWIRIPVLVTMGSNPDYWRQALLLMLVSMLPLMAFKYLSARKRPDLQPRFWACLTYPFYKQLYAAVSIMGAIRSITWYIGGHKKALSVRQMMKTNDERVIWLDPRFNSNPAFLADEGEVLKHGCGSNVSSNDTYL